MYNFNFIKDEHLIEVFDEVLIRKDNLEKITSVALTDKRLLFLDYLTNDGLEVLRISKGVNFTRYKEVYYAINLDDIESIKEEEYYKVILKNNMSFEFNNYKLYELLKINNIE